MGKEKSKTLNAIIRVNILDAYDGNKFWIVDDHRQLYTDGDQKNSMLPDAEIVKGIQNGSIKTDWAVGKKKVLVNESEFIRIVKTLDPDNCITSENDYPFIKDIVEIKIGRSCKRYDPWFAVEDEQDCGIVYVNGKRLKKIFCNSGQNRAKKVMCVAEELYDKVTEINRCGILINDLNKNYACKWEAYNGMICTDSKPVTMPHIVVVDDYENPIIETFDVIKGKVVKNQKGESEYDIDSKIKTEKRKIKILPFDGAGLVSVEMAKQWAEDLELDYLPSAWQFRMIPGVKGNVYTFDIQKFAETYHVRKIKDCWGRTWDLFDDDIDCILTKSQFKYAKMYQNFDEWKTAFDADLYGYHRTFNISDVSVPYQSTSKFPRCVKGHAVLSYQPLQTLDLTDEEIQAICADTVDWVKKTHTDIDAFLKFRGLDQEDDEKGSNTYINPALMALRYNHSLADDPYIHTLMLSELRNFRRINHIRLMLEGSFQVLIPDVFALAEYAFGLPVEGLLNAKEVYNKYYINRGIKQLDLIRFPHIFNEHCIADVVDAASQNWEEIEGWYKYQDVGYVTSMWDSFALRMGGADYDGDEIYGLADRTLIDAVKRQEAHTIYFERDPEEGEYCKKVMPDDYKALAANDSTGFSNNIGDVVNATSRLWSMVTPDNPNNEKVMNYIKVMSVIDSLTIDFVKTGIKAQVPGEIKTVLKKYKKPYFFQFRSQKEYGNAKGVQANIAVKNQIEKAEGENPVIYNDNPSTINRIAHYMDSQIAPLQAKYNVPRFDWATLLQGDYDHQDGDTYKSVKQKLLALNKQFKEFCGDEFGGYDCDLSFNQRDSKHVHLHHLRFFFQDCRNQLLIQQPDINKLVNDLIICYYADANTGIDNRSILWNCFPSQMMARVQNKKSADKIYNLDELKKQHNKMLERQKEIKKQQDDRKDIPIIDGIDAEISITDHDKKYINRRLNTQRSKRFYYSLLYIWLKINAGKEKEQWIKIGTNSKYGEISKIQIEHLAGIGYRSYNDALQSCCVEKHKMIIVDFDDIKVPKIKVIYTRQDGKEIQLPNSCKKMRSWINHYVPAKRSEKMECIEPDKRYHIKVKREDYVWNVPVVRVEDGKVYPSLKIASEDNRNISTALICGCCKHKKSHYTAGGYHWKYLKDFENENNV